MSNGDELHLPGPVIPQPPAEWVCDLVQTATDLGYGVEVLRPGSVRLAGSHGLSIEIESRFLGGPLLATLLREVAK